jgi:hypothetical protein
VLKVYCLWDSVIKEVIGRIYIFYCTPPSSRICILTHYSPSFPYFFSSPYDVLIYYITIYSTMKAWEDPSTCVSSISLYHLFIFFLFSPSLLLLPRTQWRIFLGAHGSHGSPQIWYKYYITLLLSNVMLVSQWKMKLFCTIRSWVRPLLSLFSSYFYFILF